MKKILLFLLLLPSIAIAAPRVHPLECGRIASEYIFQLGSRDIEKPDVEPFISLTCDVEDGHLFAHVNTYVDNKRYIKTVTLNEDGLVVEIMLCRLNKQGEATSCTIQ